MIARRKAAEQTATTCDKAGLAVPRLPIMSLFAHAGNVCGKNNSQVEALKVLLTSEFSSS